MDRFGVRQLIVLSMTRFGLRFVAFVIANSRTYITIKVDISNICMDKLSRVALIGQ